MVYPGYILHAFELNSLMDDTPRSLWLETNAATRAAILFEDASKYDPFIYPTLLEATLCNVASATCWLLQDSEMIFPLPAHIIFDCFAYRSQRSFVR